MRSGIPLFLVVLFVFQTVSAKTIADATAREETGGETERIIDGKPAARGQFPYAAALFSNGRFTCTSSIVSPTTLLTAAHCVVSRNGRAQPASQFHAIANFRKSASQVRIDFASVTSHPEYDGQTIENDIAVLKTSEPIEFSDEVKPVCIARPDTGMNDYVNATAMGWGQTSRIFPLIPDILQYVEQKIVENLHCSLVYMSRINEKKLCAKGLEMSDFNGVCNGDSGGPLVHMHAAEPVEIGIASYINGVARCGTPVPAVFTRVSAFHDFIMDMAGENDREKICVV